MSKKTRLLYLIFLQAFVAVFGSLYYSTFGDPVTNLAAGSFLPAGHGLTPCELCWFARILMYPILILSFIALLKDDYQVTDYILPMSVMGVLLETYHFGMQKFGFASPFGCTLANPCNALQIQYLGFVTIPLLGLVAFGIITTCAAYLYYLNSHPSDNHAVKSNSSKVE